jgi:hypothetical protein
MGRFVLLSLIIVNFSFLEKSFGSSAPTITGFVPSHAPNAAEIQIKGTGFTSTTQAIVGGVKVRSVVVNSSSLITVKLGSMTMSGPVVVTTAFGRASTAGTTLGNFKDGNFLSYCHPKIDVHRSIAVRDTLVIDDARAKGSGAWSFNFLMSQMVPSGMHTSLFIKKWLSNWARTQSVNKFNITSSNSVSNVLASWPRDPNATANEADGTRPLDLRATRFRLVAIIMRPDLSRVSAGIAGEGRFIYRIEGTPGDHVIFEYKLPISQGSVPTTLANWNFAMFRLSTGFFGHNYLSLLESLTNRFVRRHYSGVPGMQNGNAINQVRSNAIQLEGNRWRLREFRLTPTSISSSTGVVAAQVGELVSWTTEGNPNETLNVASGTLESWILQNETGLLSTSPPKPSRSTWGGITDSESTFRFSSKVPPDLHNAFNMNTCKGCHNPAVNLARNAGASNPFLQASLGGFASFMTGTTSGMATDRLVWPKKAMPGGFRRPFTFNPDRTVKANVGYSDLHMRGHKLVNTIVSNFCF